MGQGDGYQALWPQTRRCDPGEGRSSFAHSLSGQGLTGRKILLSYTFVLWDTLTSLDQKIQWKDQFGIVVKLLGAEPVGKGMPAGDQSLHAAFVMFLGWAGSWV